MSANRIIREYRLVVFGGNGVGKTALTARFIWDYFVEDYNPNIDEAARKLAVIDDEISMIDILDTDGQEEYQAMEEQYIRTGEGFILVYSITSRESFEETNRFYQQILRVKVKDNYLMVLVGSKCDLEHERQVGMNEGRDLAKHMGCSFMETSAKQPINVDAAFYSVVRQIKKYREQKSTHPAGEPQVGPVHSDGPRSAGCRSGCVVL